MRVAGRPAGAPASTATGDAPRPPERAASVEATWSRIDVASKAAKIGRAIDILEPGRPEIAPGPLGSAVRRQGAVVLRARRYFQRRGEGCAVVPQRPPGGASSLWSVDWDGLSPSATLILPVRRRCRFYFAGSRFRDLDRRFSWRAKHDHGYDRCTIR